MKRLILLLSVFTIAYTSFSQTQIQAKRGVFTDQVNIAGQWINKISTDINNADSSNNNVIATAKAVADYVRSKSMPSLTLQQVLSNGGQLTERNLILSTNDFGVMNMLPNGGLSVLGFTYADGSITLGRRSSVSACSINLGPNVFWQVAGFQNIGNEITMDNDGTRVTSYSQESSHQSSIILDSNCLELNNRVTAEIVDGAEQHKIRIFKDSIVVSADSAEFGQETNFYLLGLPASTSNTDSVLVKQQNGRLAYRASNISAGGSIAPKVYTATLTQTGTSNPVVTVLGSNTVGAIIWTRTGQGIYVGTLSNAFPTGKTFVLIGNANEYTDGPKLFNAFRDSENTINLLVKNTSLQPDDFFSEVSIEVRVYP